MSRFLHLSSRCIDGKLCFLVAFILTCMVLFSEVLMWNIKIVNVFFSDKKEIILKELWLYKYSIVNQQVYTSELNYMKVSICRAHIQWRLQKSLSLSMETPSCKMTSKPRCSPSFLWDYLPQLGPSHKWTPYINPASGRSTKWSRSFCSSRSSSYACRAWSHWWPLLGCASRLPSLVSPTPYSNPSTVSAGSYSGVVGWWREKCCSA